MSSGEANHSKVDRTTTKFNKNPKAYITLRISEKLLFG